MTDPKRLRETHGAELEGLLLASVRHDAPPAAVRARAIQAVLLGAGAASIASTTAGSAASAAPAAKSGAILIAAKWLVVGAATGTLVAGTIVGPLQGLNRSSPVEGQRAARDAVVSQAPRAPAEASNPRSSGARRSASIEDVDTTSTVARSGHSSTAFPARSAPPRGEGAVDPPGPSMPRAAAASLAEEVAAIDAAARDMGMRDPRRALAALDAYESRFPTGSLRPEATVLRVQALVQLGDVARATAIARAFLAQNPHSPHAGKLRSLVSDL